MKIIDTTTGKRMDAVDKKAQAVLAKQDPIQRNVEKGLEEEEFSPMDPPEAYAVSKDLDEIHYEDMAAGLKELVDDHNRAADQISSFEKALMDFRVAGFRLTEELNDRFSAFFQFFDDAFLPHNRKEERALFHLMHRRLIEVGEHSKSEPKTTAVDLFEDDHTKFIQLGTLCFNFLGLGVRLKDPNSQLLVMDVAYNSGVELVELMKLHIFREDHTLFPLAQKHLSAAEQAEVMAAMH